MGKEDENSGDADLQGLIAKRDELLAEVRGLRKALGELEADRDAWRVKAETSAADYERAVLTGPRDALLGKLFRVKLRHVLPDILEAFSFTTNAEGGIDFRTAAGAPVLVDGGREAKFDPDDVLKALQDLGTFAEALRDFRAKGDLGRGSNWRDISRRTEAGQEEKPAPRTVPGLGMR